LRAAIGPPKDNMHIPETRRADLPRRRLSLRFDEKPRGEPSHLRSPIPPKELRRIVAEMLG